MKVINVFPTHTIKPDQVDEIAELFLVIEDAQGNRATVAGHLVGFSGLGPLWLNDVLRVAMYHTTPTEEPATQ